MQKTPSGGASPKQKKKKEKEKRKRKREIKRKIFVIKRILQMQNVSLEAK